MTVATTPTKPPGAARRRHESQLRLMEEQQPFLGFPKHLQRFYYNTTIMVVDDRPEAAQRTADALAPYYTEENGCNIIVVTSSQHALDLIASGEAAPDVLALDLYMPPGPHGDSFLKTLSYEHDIHVPVVINSGSWANPIKVPFFEKLAESENENQVEEAANECMYQPWVPVTRLIKYGPGDYPRALALAIDGVLRIGERDREEDFTHMRGFLVDFDERSREQDTPRGDYIAYLAETADLLAEDLPEFIAAVGERYPEFWEASGINFDTIDMVRESLASGEYSALTFSDEDEGAAIRHTFLGVIGSLTIELQVDEDAVLAVDADRGREFLQYITEQHSRWQGFLDQAKLIQASSDVDRSMDLRYTWSGIRTPVVARGRRLDDVRYEEDLGETPLAAVTNHRFILRSITELLRNALKATEGVDDPRVSLRMRAVGYGELPDDMQEFFSGDVDSRFAAISVADNGCSIQPGELGRIWEKYYTRFPGGTGLGLDIIKRTCDERGIGVHVDSAPGEGSTFTLYVKLAEEEASS